MTERADTTRDQRRADKQATPSKALVPNQATKTPLKSSLQPIKVKHLREWANYREKIGDGFGAFIVFRALEDSPDDARITPVDLVRGRSEQETKILIAACAFVLDLYRDLEVLI